jgi:transcription initiation factor TFIIB
VIETVKCPECQSEVVINQGEQVCSKCGLVLSENHLINKPEWNFFTKNKLIHTGYSENINIHDKGLPTVIGGNKDIRGRPISAETKYSMFRIRRIQRQTIVGNERTLGMGLELINLYSDKLDIPYSVRSRASLIFRQMADQGLVRGRSIFSIAIASIYYVCREGQVVRSLDEVVKATGIQKKTLTKCYRLLLGTTSKKIEPYSYTKYISRIGNDLHIQEKLQGDAIKLLNDVQTNSRHLSGKDPKGLAASALYIVCKNNNLQVTQKSLAVSAHTTEVTVRNRYKDLVKIINKNQNRDEEQID